MSERDNNNKPIKEADDFEGERPAQQRKVDLPPPPHGSRRGSVRVKVMTRLGKCMLIVLHRGGGRVFATSYLPPLWRAAHV